MRHVHLGGGFPSPARGGLPPPLIDRRTQTNGHNHSPLLCLTMVHVGTRFAQSIPRGKQTDRESQSQQACCKPGSVVHNIHRGVYMAALVRALSCRAPCAQRLPNDAQARFPSPKPVTAANPLSMNHDMHTCIPPLHCTPPFSCSHCGGGRGGAGDFMHVIPLLLSLTLGRW